jgi:hypothetical protein
MSNNPNVSYSNPQTSFNFGQPVNNDPNAAFNNLGQFQHSAGQFANRYSKYEPSSVHEANLMPWLGLPNKPFESADPFSSRSQEYYTLPFGYVGPNALITKILISRLTNKDLWPCILALPWKECNTMELTWDIWKFDNILPGRTPEETLSQMTTSSLSSGAASLIRQGLACAIEHGFYMTPKGRMHFRCQLMQIDFAIGEGQSLGAQEAILKAQMPSTVLNSAINNEHTYIGGNNMNNVNVLKMKFDNDRYTWAGSQKNENG